MLIDDAPVSARVDLIHVGESAGMEKSETWAARVVDDSCRSHGFCAAVGIMDNTTDATAFVSGVPVT